MKSGQVMKEHKAPFPILIHVLDGEINFTAAGEKSLLKKGSIVTLEGNVPHDLTANQDSVVRLTLSKLDKVERVDKVID